MRTIRGILNRGHIKKNKETVGDLSGKPVVTAVRIK